MLTEVSTSLTTLLTWMIYTSTNMKLKRCVNHSMLSFIILSMVIAFYRVSKVIKWLGMTARNIFPHFTSNIFLWLRCLNHSSFKPWTLHTYVQTNIVTYCLASVCSSLINKYADFIDFFNSIQSARMKKKTLGYVIYQCFNGTFSWSLFK